MCVHREVADSLYRLFDGDFDRVECENVAHVVVVNMTSQARLRRLVQCLGDKTRQEAMQTHWWRVMLSRNPVDTLDTKAIGLHVSECMQSQKSQNVLNYKRFDAKTTDVGAASSSSFSGIVPSVNGTVLYGNDTLNWIRCVLVPGTAHAVFSDMPPEFGARHIHHVSDNIADFYMTSRQVSVCLRWFARRCVSGRDVLRVVFYSNLRLMQNDTSIDVATMLSNYLAFMWVYACGHVTLSPRTTDDFGQLLMLLINALLLVDKQNLRNYEPSSVTPLQAISGMCPQRVLRTVASAASNKTGDGSAYVSHRPLNDRDHRMLTGESRVGGNNATEMRIPLHMLTP